MKSFQTAILLWCFVFLPQQFLHAAQPLGQVIGWGNNISGEATGTPSFPFINGKVVMTENPSATGVVVSAGQVLRNVVKVSAGYGFSLALCSDGTVIGFGGNFLGQAVGTTNDYPYRANAQVKFGGQILSNVLSIATGRNFGLALKKDGTVVTWGENMVPVGLSNIVEIAAAYSTSLALKKDGTVVEWDGEKSLPQYGQLREVWGLSNVVAVAIGESAQGTRDLALKKDGTVEHWGEETDYKDATSPADLTNVVAVAAGYNHSLALTRDGTVTGWGFNNAGQATGIPNTNFISVSAGQVKIGGQVLRNVVSIAAGHGYSLALKKDGTVVAWGRMQNDLYPATVPAGLSNVVAIAAGDNFCLAITTNSVIAEKFHRRK